MHIALSPKKSIVFRLFISYLLIFFYFVFPVGAQDLSPKNIDQGLSPAQKKMLQQGQFQNLPQDIQGQLKQRLAKDKQKNQNQELTRQDSEEKEGKSKKEEWL